MVVNMSPIAVVRARMLVRFGTRRGAVQERPVP